MISNLWAHDKVAAILAYALTAGFFILLFMFIFFQVPAGSKDVLQIMLGILGTAWIAVITYYFGSSSGSKAKEKYIENLKK
jgi:hypothetical protein